MTQLCPRAVAALFACTLLLCGCGANADAPSVRLAGMVMAEHLDEISGMATSRRYGDTLWVINDGGHSPHLHAISRLGRLLTSVRVDAVPHTDWEDLAAFELDGRPYLLIADTGDNGGLRKTLQLHVLPEPDRLQAASLKPAWSIVFRWPDGPRDCEAVAVDAERGLVLLLTKKRQPAELYALPLRPGDPRTVLTARLLAHLQPAEGVQADATVGGVPANQITAADVSPDGSRLAVLSYGAILIHARDPATGWTQAAANPPQRIPIPLVPKAEALTWSASGGGLYVTGEFSPAPIFHVIP